MTPRHGGLHEADPIFSWLLILVASGEDFDDLAILDVVIERDDTAIGLGSGCGIADLAMDGVGEVDGRRFFRELDDVTFRGEGEDVVFEEFDFETFHELGVVTTDLPLPILELLDPDKLAWSFGGTPSKEEVSPAGAFPLSIEPVGGDAEFGFIMHFLGAYLDFQDAALGTEDGGMEGLVTVWLREGDIVLDPADHRTVALVDDAECFITIGDFRYDDTHREEVVDTVNVHIMALELLVKSEGVLDATMDIEGRYTLLFQFTPEDLDGFVDVVAFGTGALLKESLGDGVVLRFEIFEREVFELHFDLVYAEAIGDWREDVHSFAGDTFSFFRWEIVQCTHVMEPVGEFDDDDTDVGRHGEEHLTEVLKEVLFALTMKSDLGKLGDAVDDVGDFRTETLLYLREGDSRVFGYIMQESCRDSAGIHADASEDLGGAEAMDDIGFARASLLFLVGISSDGIGIRDEPPVLVGERSLAGLEDIVDRESCFHRNDHLQYSTSWSFCVRLDVSMTCQYTMDFLKSTVSWRVAVFAVLLGVILVAWSSMRTVSVPQGGGGTISVVVSFYPLAQFASAVGGERVHVATIIPAGVEPHDYEPTPRDIASVYGAKLFLFNGAGLDAWAKKIQPEATSQGVRTLEMTSLFELRALDGATDSSQTPLDCTSDVTDCASQSVTATDQNSGVDPHIWLDPVLATRQVEAIRDALTGIDPSGRDTYARNAEQYTNQLQSLDESYRSALADCSLDTIVVSHDAFGYLADRYGFHILPITGVSPDQEPTLDRLSSLVRMVREQKIKTIFFETLASPKVAETLATEAGVRTEVLNPIEGVSEADQAAGLDYLSLMKENLDHIKGALECR